MEAVATITASAAPRLAEVLPSPDGAWRAEFYAYDCVEVAPGVAFAYQEARLVSTGSGADALVESQLIVCGGLGAYGLAGRFWSPNSRYVYFTNAAAGVPDGCGYWTPPYLRADTVNWTVEALGMGAVSPDGTFLAAWQGEQLGVWHVDGDLIGLVETPTLVRVPGPIAWRPDSSAIAFLISEGYCPLGETHLGRLDLSDMRPIMILAHRNPSFADLVWDAPNRLTLADEQGGRWRYNFLSRDLWEVSP